MKKVVVGLVAAGICLCVIGPLVREAKAADGAHLFKQHCAVCHPNGGNIINPSFTLHKKDREAHGVKTVQDVIGRMRNPGPGMTKFDTRTINDDDAKKIAEYVLETFKK